MKKPTEGDFKYCWLCKAKIHWAKVQCPSCGSKQ